MRANIQTVSKKLKRLRGSPVSLARGTAVGVFIGFAPVMPFKSMLILAITLATRSSTVAALLICTLICNPLTYLPLYYLAWLLGDLMLPGRISWAIFKATIAQILEAGLLQGMLLTGQMGLDMALVLLTGGVVLALPLAIAGYCVAFQFFARREHQLQGEAES